MAAPGLADAALEYRQHGLSVIPVGRDKHPLVEWRAFRLELPHVDQVSMWWHERPGAPTPS